MQSSEIEKNAFHTPNISNKKPIRYKFSKMKLDFRASRTPINNEIMYRTSNNSSNFQMKEIKRN